MSNISLEQQLNTLPDKPGVYIFKDAKGNMLYVGKAKVLKHRVRSYFQPGQVLDPAKQKMVPKIASLDTIATDTENEALVLEANLIQKHQPPYNVVLRDDKYYLFIKITTNEDLPRVFPIRRLRKDGARYFGPYSSARSVRATLKLLRRIFPFKEEKEHPREKIFPHPLFSSLAQSGNMVEDKAQPDPQHYQENIQNIIRFLKGDREAIMRKLRAGMAEAAARQQYERARIFRDQLLAIERLEGSQKVYLPTKDSFDLISIARAHNRSAANVFSIREGKLLGKNTFLLKHRLSSEAEDVLRQFILQYYQVAQNIPKMIFVPFHLNDEQAIGEWINKETPPTFTIPQRGKKHELLIMGEVNAKHLLEQDQLSVITNERLQHASQELAQYLGLTPPSAPDGATRGNQLQRVEIYDVSNIQGNLATASMVVFENGQPKPARYRKFKLRLSGEPNDFAMLQEALRRRFSNRHPDWPLPDLIIIDGGKGQLSAAKAVIDELKVVSPVISLAKREEEIFTSPAKLEGRSGVSRSKSVRLPYDSDALYLIQRMRDEAHRFTITYHRLLRSKKQQRSLLDDIPGIGPKTKRRLLNHFGSVKAIRAAEFSELTKIIGEVKAKTLQASL